MYNGRFEIWFPSPEEVSIFIETTDTGERREVAEVAFFAAFAARQIANLKNDIGGQTLCAALAEVPHPDSYEEISQAIGDAKIVPPSPSQGRKGFVGSFTTRTGVPLVQLKPKGFGVLGRGVDYYAPTATMALLIYLLGRHSPDGRFALVETAHNIGGLGLIGEVGVRDQGVAASTAVALALRKLSDTRALVRRSDDPEDDYQLLLDGTQRMLADLLDETTGQRERLGVPDWVTWFTCREMTAQHYQILGESGYQLRREAAAKGPGPWPYHDYLEELIEAHELVDVVERLRADCYGG